MATNGQGPAAHCTDLKSTSEIGQDHFSNIPEKCRFDPGKEETEDLMCKTVGCDHHPWAMPGAPGMPAFLGTVCLDTVCGANMGTMGLKLDLLRQGTIWRELPISSVETQVTPQTWRWS